MLDDISPSRLQARDWSNIYPDPNMEDASLYAGSAFTISWPSIGAIPVTCVSENVVWLKASTEPQETFTPVWPVEAGRPYFLSARIGRITGEGPSTTRLMISSYSDFEASALISSERAGGDVNEIAPAAVAATLPAPANAVRARFSVQKDASAGAIAPLCSM